MIAHRFSEMETMERAILVECWGVAICSGIGSDMAMRNLTL